MKNSLTFFLICFSILSFSQSNKIFNKWVLEKSVLCNEDKELEGDTKYNIEFYENGIAEISFNTIKDKIELKYVVKNNGIIINDEKYIIDTLLEDILILVYNFDNVCRKLYFKSEKGMFEAQLNNYVLYNDEPVYFANEFNHPNLIGYNDLNEYFKRAYFENAIEKDYCDIKFIFIVTKDGNLRKERGNLSCKKKADKIISKIFESTKNKWEPMRINNKPVNAYMEIKFKLKIDKVELNQSEINTMSRFQMRNMIIKHNNKFP
jgi:hypothetical protein